MVNKVSFIIFCIILVVAQFLTNNFSIFYVDLFAILLVSLLLRGNLLWMQLIILSFVGDLIGHWFLGTHLLAVVLLSYFTNKIANFYRMCGWFPRTLISIFYLAIFYLIVYIVELSTKRVVTSLDDILVQLLVFLPLVQLVLNLLTTQKSSEYYF